MSHSQHPHYIICRADLFAGFKKICPYNPPKNAHNIFVRQRDRL